MGEVKNRVFDLPESFSVGVIEPFPLACRLLLLLFLFGSGELEMLLGRLPFTGFAGLLRAGAPLRGGDCLPL